MEKIKANTYQYNYLLSFIERWDADKENGEVDQEILEEEYILFLDKYKLPHLSADELIDLLDID